jgi:hypothetical protein
MTHRRQGREQRTVALGITDQPVTVEKCVMLTITLRWPRDHVGHQVKELIELLGRWVVSGENERKSPPISSSDKEGNRDGCRKAER